MFKIKNTCIKLKYTDYRPSELKNVWVIFLLDYANINSTLNYFYLK